MRTLILSLILCNTTFAAGQFTDAEKRHCENQFGDIFFDWVETINRKHPNPKTEMKDGVFDPWSPAMSFAHWLYTQQRVKWQHTGRGNRSEIAYRWFEKADGTLDLHVVSSDWCDRYFDKTDKGETLRDSLIVYAKFEDVRILPHSSQQLDSWHKKDYPVVNYESYKPVWAGNYTYFSFNFAHDGQRTVNWDLYLDPNEMNPLFGDWFKWHEKNQLLALWERWPDFDFDRKEWQQGVRTDKHIHWSPYYFGELGLEHRVTRRKYYQKWRFAGRINATPKINVFKQVKVWNMSSFSMRTKTIYLKDCQKQLDGMYDISHYIFFNGEDHVRDRMEETWNKLWTMDVTLPIADELGPTRYKLIRKNQQ